MPREDIEPGWSIFCIFIDAEMQTGKKKGIKVLVFQYRAVTKYPAFWGWEGCLPTLRSSEREYKEKIFALDTINIVFCPVLLQKKSLSHQIRLVTIRLARKTRGESLLETFPCLQASGLGNDTWLFL